MPFKCDFATDVETQLERRRVNRPRMRASESLVRDLMAEHSPIVDMHKSLSTKRVWFAFARGDVARKRLEEFRDYSLHNDFLEEFRGEYKKLITGDSLITWYRVFNRLHPNMAKAEHS